TARPSSLAGPDARKVVSKKTRMPGGVMHCVDFHHGRDGMVRRLVPWVEGSRPQPVPTWNFRWWVRLISPRLRFGLVCPYQPEAQARRLETDPPPRFNLPAHLAAIAPDL